MFLAHKTETQLKQDAKTVVCTKVPRIVVYHWEAPHQNVEFTKKMNQKQSHDSDSNYEYKKWRFQL